MLTNTSTTTKANLSDGNADQANLSALRAKAAQIQKVQYQVLLYMEIVSLS